MAITKEYLNQDWDDLATFLSESGFFGSVTHAENVITCKDDDNTLLTIDHSASSVAFTVYASDSVYKSINITNSPKPSYGCKCTNGIMLDFLASASHYMILAAKTNNNKTAVIISSTSGSGYENPSKTYYCVANGDDGPLATDAFSPRSKNQTQIVTFTTNNAANTISYTPNAGYLSVAQYYSMGLGTLTINGDNYLTNGYWVIKD